MIERPLNDASAETFTGGKLFDSLFVRGMALVEETAAYLDGPGRTAADTLPREASLTYSAWTMELTTRLMQAASWLVMQKAVRDGEMPSVDAAHKKYRLRAEAPMLETGAQKELGLPPRFLDLVDRSEHLFEQVCRLDAAIYVRVEKPAINPVTEQWAQIQQAADTGAFNPIFNWRRAR